MGIRLGFEVLFPEFRYFGDDVLVVRTGLVVNVHKAALHTVLAFNFVLELHAQIVRFKQQCRRVHDDFHFDEKFGTKVVRPDRIDRESTIKGVGNLNEFFNEFFRCRFARQVLNLFPPRLVPRVDNVNTDENGRKGVHKPQILVVIHDTSATAATRLDRASLA